MQDSWCMVSKRSIDPMPSEARKPPPRAKEGPFLLQRDIQRLDLAANFDLEDSIEALARVSLPLQDPICSVQSMKGKRICPIVDQP